MLLSIHFHFLFYSIVIIYYILNYQILMLNIKIVGINCPTYKNPRSQLSYQWVLNILDT